LSIFASARFGSGLSVLDYVSVGKTMSVGSIKTRRIGDGAEPFPDDPETEVASVRTNAGTRIDFLYSPPAADGTSPTPGPKMDFYVGGSHSMSMSKKDPNNPAIGVLHGIWEADATITTSDRRLKTSIEPLYRTIAARAKARWSEMRSDPAPGDSAAQTAVGLKKDDPPIGWLLRELRPVSFKLKSGPEAKHLKFGFIAQELETVFPNLVRNVGGDPDSEDGTKAIVSQDLIAVLTLAVQNLQKEMEKQRDWFRRDLEEQKKDFAALMADYRMRLDRIERAVFAAPRV